MAPLPPRDQRHPWLRYQVKRYTEDIVHNFEQRLETIFGRSVNRVHVLDVAGLTKEMRQTLVDRLRMVCTGDKGHELFTSHAWRRLFEIRGPLVQEFILEFLGTCRMRDTVMGLDVPDTLCFQLGRARRRMTWSISGRGQVPEKVTDIDLFYLRNMDHGPKNVPYMLEQYYFRYAEGRKSGASLSEGHFIGRLAAYFGLVSDEGLRGLSVITHELSVIDLHELVRLNICVRLGDTWAWVSPGPERHPAVTGGALKDAEGAHDKVEGGQVVLAPVQAPQPPPPTLFRTIAQSLSVLEDEVHSLGDDMGEQMGVLDSMARDFSRFTTWTVTSLSRMMDRSGVR
ncbi:hypothetical protein Tco_0158864 [Tanacetum coccineum]